MTNSNDDNGSPAAAPAIASSTSKPSYYIMGKYVESDAGVGDWYIIAGLKPKADWSGIDTTKKEETYMPTQKRRFNSKREVTKYGDSIAPMTTKYKDGMSTRELKLAIVNHSMATTMVVETIKAIKATGEIEE